jgi:ABC-type nitrate/sulfonate/bicarbonate transport system substrate-binding protein
MVETDFVSGNGSDAIQALMRGQVDVYIGTLAELTRIDAQAIASHHPPPLVAVAAGNPGAATLVLRKDIPFHTLTDLKGLVIGVSSLGTGGLIPFRYLLAEHGLSTNSLNIRLVQVGGAEMPPALLTRQIDGFLHSELTAATAVLKAGGKIALSKSDFGAASAAPAVGVIVTRAWAAGHRSVVQKVVDTLEQASTDYPKMPKAQVLAEFADFISREPDVLEFAYTLVDPRLYNLHQMADAHFKTAIPAMQERGELTVDLSPDDLFDFSFSHIETRTAN